MIINDLQLNGSGLLFAGRFADLFGRKYLYLGGLSIYCVFSIVSAIVKVSLTRLISQSQIRWLTCRTESVYAYCDLSQASGLQWRHPLASV
jgi:hypothetical protein